MKPKNTFVEFKNKSMYYCVFLIKKNKNKEVLIGKIKRNDTEFGEAPYWEFVPHTNIKKTFPAWLMKEISDFMESI